MKPYAMLIDGELTLILERIAAGRTSVAVLFVLANLASGCGDPGAPTPIPSPPASADLLSATGLYADIATKGVAGPNRPYSPQYALWSDGGIKRRWLFLAAGTRIDTSNPDRWVFPVGTKIWKEFAYEGRRVETRLLEKLNDQASIDGWSLRVYAWRADESDALLVGAGGQLDAAPTAFGTLHDIPTQAQCLWCHDRGGDPVLGVDALQLSGDRDPLAVEPVPDGAIDLRSLATEERLTHPPAEQPRIVANSGTARWAIGYLHGNCGNCHNPQGRAEATGQFLRHEGHVERERDEPAYRTAVNQLTRLYIVPGTQLGKDSYRIRGGAPDQSAVYLRMQARDRESMPPIGSEVNDAEALGLLRDWIRGLPRP